MWIGDLLERWLVFRLHRTVSLEKMEASEGGLWDIHFPVEFPLPSSTPKSPEFYHSSSPFLSPLLSISNSWNLSVAMADDCWKQALGTPISNPESLPQELGDLWQCRGLKSKWNLCIPFIFAIKAAAQKNVVKACFTCFLELPVLEIATFWNLKSQSLGRELIGMCCHKEFLLKLPFPKLCSLESVVILDILQATPGG